jgi:sulfatase modifying factor 1
MNRIQPLPELVAVPGGTIRMRDDRTKRAWTVPVAPFWLGRVPTTQSQFRAVTGKDPSMFRGDDAYPVESVSWWDAVNFCNALSDAAGFPRAYQTTGEDVLWDQAASGFRLPTEAEWEYACRAGTSTPRYAELDAIAWFRGNSDGRPHPVGQKEPNAWGLHDMLGNVWEWCWDMYDPAVYGTYRVFRGGGWADEERGCLASNRRRSHPTYSVDDVGFRVARTK